MLLTQVTSIPSACRPREPLGFARQTVVAAAKVENADVGRPSLGFLDRYDGGVRSTTLGDDRASPVTGLFEDLRKPSARLLGADRSRRYGPPPDLSVRSVRSQVSGKTVDALRVDR